MHIVNVGRSHLTDVETAWHVLLSAHYSRQCAFTRDGSLVQCVPFHVITPARCKSHVMLNAFKAHYLHVGT
jgi:hypothetical protein